MELNISNLCRGVCLHFHAAGLSAATYSSGGRRKLSIKLPCVSDTTLNAGTGNVRLSKVLLTTVFSGKRGRRGSEFSRWYGKESRPLLVTTSRSGSV